jgi:hypothetical protein
VDGLKLARYAPRDPGFRPDISPCFSFFCGPARATISRAAGIERGRRTDETNALEYLYNLYEARPQLSKEPAAARLERCIRIIDKITRPTPRNSFYRD